MGVMSDRITPINKALILANVVMFGLQYLTAGTLDAWFALWPPQAAAVFDGAPSFQVWQLLTYGFLHGNLAHLFFNMFTLFMFGSDIERLYGPRRYLTYYLLCVVGAALMHLLIVTMTTLPPAPIVGASGGIFGLLLAFGIAFPQRMLMLVFPPIPMRAWLLVTLYGLFELYLGVTQTSDGIAHVAHLGGMATGFVIIRYWRAQDAVARRR